MRVAVHLGLGRSLAAAVQFLTTRWCSFLLDLPHISSQAVLETEGSMARQVSATEVEERYCCTGAIE
jgi:hypothetical protein